MIARWNIEPHNGGGYSDVPAPTFGKWVKYEDHQKEVAELKEKLADVELELIMERAGADY